ncbi:extracellular solute-binding protein [Haloarcula litorea]|uniref:extracellular solute-binding protein n=1 Tax=Haloarcula litorea TaxID=3032579 RepID=UPI0023E75FB0|nr:extracellular solute-binding protein [Halomicroarcula sp. GDY20]
MADSSPRTDLKRRQFIEAAGATGVTALLAGCGGDGGGGTPTDGDGGSDGSGGGTTTDTKTSESFTLEYVDVDGDRAKKHFTPVIEELNGKYDADISLRFREIPYGNMKKQLLTRVGGGNAPDVAAIDQIWLGSFYESGKLMSFSDMKSEVNFEDYFAGFKPAVQQEGNLVGFPITTDVRGMYWHKDMVEEAGFDPASPPETWSEFYELGKQVHNPPETYGTGIIVASGIWSVPLFSTGGQFLSADGTTPKFNSEAGYQAASFYDAIYNTEDFGPPEPIFGDHSMPREFIKGTYATTPVYGSWLDFFARQEGMSNEEIKQQFGFGLTPHPEGGQPATMNGGFAWAAFNTTERPDIVRDFMKRISTKEFNRKIAKVSGRIPTRQSLLDASDVWENILWSDTIKGMLEHGGTRPVNNWSTVSSALNPELQRVAFDRAEPEQALQNAAEKFNSQV